MKLTERQHRIIELVKAHEPITGDRLGEYLAVSRGTIRPDLAVLTMMGILVAKPKVGYFFNGVQKDTSLTDLFSITVDEIKSVPIVIEDTASIYDAAVMMFLEDVGTVFVVKKGYLTGVVSRKDLLKATLGGNDAQSLPVSVVMTRVANIIYCNQNDVLMDAIKKIVEYHIDCLPIVTEEAPNAYKVIGRVSKTNIARYIVEISQQRKERSS